MHSQSVAAEGLIDTPDGTRLRTRSLRELVAYMNHQVRSVHQCKQFTFGKCVACCNI